MFSNLISCINRSPNHYNGRTTKVCKFTPHHVAGVVTAERIGEIFAPRSRNASCNYGIGNDGRIIGIVDEENGAWTSSSYWNDNQAITVEVSNCEVGGEWKISDEAWNSLVKLAVDVCRRYGFRLDYTGDQNGTLTEHRMYVPTACPGEYLHSRMNELAKTVNSILDSEPMPTPQPAPKPIPGEPNYTGPITYQAFDGKWEKEVNKCDSTPEGYAGDSIHYLSGVRAKPKYGEIIIEAHELGGNWLGPISSQNYKANDTMDGNSYAGIYNKPMDLVRIKSTRGYVDYRVLVKIKGNLQWLEWVRGFGDKPNEYAGIVGLPMYGIQMK